ncbi:Exocyst complex component Sec10-like protein [Elaphomyces granulatus]
MSKFKKVPVSGGPPRRDILASLKMASIEISKPVLPAEIMSSILDHLGPIDLIRMARVSKKMQEMAYDDTRWVQVLKRIGCWNELEARRGAEKTTGPTLPEKAERYQSAHTVSGPDLDKPALSDRNGYLFDGFDPISLSMVKPSEGSTDPAQDKALMALNLVKSTRGQARQEYGKLHSVLAPFYEDIVDSGGSIDNLVFKVYGEPESQARILAQLQAFAKSDITEGWVERRQRLNTAVSLFETAAIREFRNGYESDDIDDLMRRYAYVLWTLNGAGSALSLFIHHNHLVTRKSGFGNITDCIDQLTGAIKLQHTQAYLTRLGAAYNEEISIIDRAFPSKLKVISPFLSKIGKDILSPFFTALFDELHRVNIESYLKAVSGTFVQCMAFMQDLRPTQSSGDDFYDTVACVISEVYEQHIDFYLAEELDFFKKACDARVGDWDRQLSEQAASTESFLMSNVNRQADKNDFLSSFKKVLMMPVNILPNFAGKPNPPKPGDGLAAGDTATAPKTTNRFLPEAPTNELSAKAAIMNSKLEGIHSLFSIEVALSLVHAAKTSLERAAEFVVLDGEYGVAAKHQCAAIFVALLNNLGHRHVIEGFDKAVDHLSNYRPREQRERDKSGVEPLVTFLELVNVGDLILQMVDVFYEQELVGSKLTDRNDFLDPAVKGKKRFEQMLDERVAAGLHKGIDVLMEEVDYILATKQPATDFNPEVSINPKRLTMDVNTSAAAIAVVDVVSSHTQMLIGSTDKSTLDVFNQEVGLRLFNALCKHLKRQRISVEGSLKLISDMNHYLKFIQALRNSELLLYFRSLQELAQIYLIDPSDAKELASIIADGDRFYGILRAEEVYEFAKRRADWHLVGRSVERAMYGIGCNVM